MDRVNRWLLWLIVIGPIHMGEQLLTSIEEFYLLREQLGGYYAMFDPAFADSATVILITIVFTLVSVVIYAAMVGGRARLAVAGLFGFLGVMEVHHVFGSIAKAGYDPGVVTCVAYFAVGCPMVREVWRVWRGSRSEPATAPAMLSLRG
jgi:Protein of unknown function with HXXEE motif